MHTRALLLLIIILPLLPSWGCMERRQRRAAATAAAPRAVPQPTTAGPSAAPPTRVAGPISTAAAYDPARDARNRAGFSWPPPRSAENPADARKRAFTIEALYQARKVADPRVSPDGKQVLVVVTSYQLKAGTANSEIYLAPADGSAPARRLTRHAGADDQPRWLPDSASFVFVSTRKDGPQLWRMDLGGGEPRQLTHLCTGVRAPTVSPDGKLVALSSRVFPECGADDACNKARLQDARQSPLKAHLADELLYRHWNSYAAGRRSHVLMLDLASERLLDLSPGEVDALATSQRGTGFTFSPDSRELCYVANRQAPGARSWTTNKDLLVVPARGGRVVNITAANKAYDGQPSYSPDGRWIAFLRQQRPGFESDRFRLALYDRKLGTVRVLTDGFDNWVLDLRWTASGRSLLFRAPVKGRFPLFSVELSSGRIARLPIPSAGGFDLAGGRLALTHSRVDAPGELFVAGVDGREVRRLTLFNQGLRQRVDLRPVEELWLPGAGGRKVHTFIVKPHGYSPGKKYPLIINVHGGPQYQWADSFRGDWQVYPGAGYVVAFFNPHGSIGYGQAYIDAISRDWGGKVYQDVMRVTDALVKLPYVDAQRVGAMGWSYGGYMMNWLLGHTRRFKAVASMMGIFDLASFYGATEELWFPEWDLGGPAWEQAAAYARWSPSSHVRKFITPTLIITGERDYRVPYTQSLQLFTALRRRNVPARLIVFPDDGHWPSFVKSMPLYYAAHLDWFSRYLGGGGSPWEIQQMVRGRAFKQKK